MSVGEILLCLYIVYLGIVLYGKDKRIKDLEKERNAYYYAWQDQVQAHGKEDR